MTKAAHTPALAYEKVYVPAFFAPLGNALLDRIKPSTTDRILDVACGTGILGRLIHGRVGAPKRLVGIDINPAMVEVARDLAPLAEHEHGDATELGFGAADFDVVLCQHGLMFFPDRAKALREMRRVVAAGSRVPTNHALFSKVRWPRIETLLDAYSATRVRFAAPGQPRVPSVRLKAVVRSV